MAKTLGMFLGLFACAMALAGAAEPENKPATPPPPPPPAAGKPERLDEMVVTASRLPTDPHKLGSSFSVLPEEEFRTRRPLDAWELLRFSPGVVFSRTGSRGTLTSLHLRGGESDHTLVLLDGFKVNDAGGGFSWDTLHPATSARAEILRGAGGALYGADAMSGVVQVMTERGSGEPRAEASFEAGTYHTTREELRLIGEEGEMAYNLGLSRFDLTEGRFENSDSRATTFGGRIDLDTPVGLHARLVIHSFGDEKGNYADEEMPDPNARVENTRDLLGLELSGLIADAVDSRLLIGRSNTNYFYEDDLDEEDDTLWRTNKDMERLSVDWQNSAEVYRWGPAVGTVVVGTAWEEERGRFDLSGEGASTSSNVIDRTRTARSLYGQKRVEIWEALTLDAGVRVEDHSNYGTETSTRLAAGLWIEQTGTRLHGSWGRGVKSPTFNENFDNSVFNMGFGDTFTRGNPDLDPEETITADLGIEQHLFEDRLVVGATLFRNEVREQIDWVPLDVFFVNSTYVNAGKSRSHGAEFEMAARPTDWLRARGSLTLLRTEAVSDDDSPSFSDGRQLIRRPQETYNLSVEIDPLVPWEGSPEWARRLTLYTEVLYESGSVDVDWDAYQRVNMETFTVVNTGLDWEVCDGLRLFARVNNVFNEDYAQVVGMSGERSTFLGGLGYTLKF